MFFKFRKEKPPGEVGLQATEQQTAIPEIVRELTLNRLFTRCHINIIQPCYVPNISAAFDMSKMILTICCDDWQQYPPFNRTAAENYLAAVIWFFINYRPTGFKDGIALRHMIHYTVNSDMEAVTEDDLELVYKGWSEFSAIDSMGNEVLDFIDKGGRNLTKKGEDMISKLKDMSYFDKEGRFITIIRDWYIDNCQTETVPDTIMGRYSDLGHVLQFIFSPYEKAFDVLMWCDAQIKALVMPFVTAWRNKSLDQLEEMMGTLRIVLSRLVSPMAYFLFTSGDDIHLLDKAEGFNYRLVINSDGYEGVATTNILRLYGTLAKSYDWTVEYKHSCRDKSVDALPILTKNFKKVCADIDRLFSSVEGSDFLERDATKTNQESQQPSKPANAPISEVDDVVAQLGELYYSLANDKKGKQQ